MHVLSNISHSVEFVTSCPSLNAEVGRSSQNTNENFASECQRENLIFFTWSQKSFECWQFDGKQRNFCVIILPPLEQKINIELILKIVDSALASDTFKSQNHFINSKE